jgi:cytochrome c peroxidase
MAGRVLCTVLLLLGASAGDDPSPSPDRAANQANGHAKNSEASRRRMLYHLAEGSEIFPLDWLLALRSAKTGKPFLEDPERFGLIPDHEPLEIPGLESVRLPIGLTIGTPQDVTGAFAAIKTSPAPHHLLPIRMVGVNCAACHVGRLRYNNKDLPIIDGAPNTFNIDSFYQELFQSAVETVLKRDKFERFLGDLEKVSAKTEISHILVTTFHRIKNDPSSISSTLDKALFNIIRELHDGASYNAPRQDDAVLRGIVERLRQLGSHGQIASMNRFLDAHILLFDRLEFLNTLKSLHTGDEQVTRPGPGRIDAFGNARRLVFKDAPKIALNAPVSFPHLWGISELDWFHWDGNTNSFMERNIGQAMGLGAIADLGTGASTIAILNIHTLESLFSQLSPPKWPEDQFGPVDIASDQYRNGARLYVEHCARCHDRNEGGQKSQDGSITYSLQEIGTDDLRATNFAVPLEDGKPFTHGLQAVAEKVKNHAAGEAGPAEHRGRFDLPEQQIRWITTRGYVARPLEGIWATAPYLHNGSVPTLDDLLKPTDERPVTFPLGHREYDPVKLGYVSDPTKVPASEQSRIFKFDTRIAGNSNRGHLYGTKLNPIERAALLEFLKVMDPPDRFAPKSGRSSAGVGVEEVPPTEAADIEVLKGLQLEQMEMEAALKHAKPVDRGQHPKHHGFLIARFTVADNIPAELRVGLFRESKTYTAVIRYSSTGEHDDRVLDNHGMAIKVLGVKSTGPVADPKGEQLHTQDFILLDHPLFFTPNVASLVAFSKMKKSLVLGKHLTGKALLEALKESFPNEVRLIEGRKKHIKNPLEEEYFSTTPYKLGETAVKYSAKPEYLKDYLRDALVERLRPRDRKPHGSTPSRPVARFDFCVQRQSDPSTMPIEDPTLEWTSPWEKVATIEVDAQDFDFPARWDWGNKLSFSPWHALEEHRPLGGINRARRQVYPASFGLRYGNLTAPKEPTEAEIPYKK